jgi:hypothetical protein
MILLPAWTTAEKDGSGIVKKVTEEIAAACGDDLSLDDLQIQELARAVAHFIERECGGDQGDERSLVMLASRALASLGETQVARRLFVCGSGLVQPSEWEVTGRDSMWVLDLCQLTVLDTCPLELVFFKCLNAILSSVAGVWDSSSGAGVLGLRHVSATAVSLVGVGGSCSDVKAFVSEIKNVCRHNLDAVRCARGWSNVPFLMDLDVSAS